MIDLCRKATVQEREEKGKWFRLNELLELLDQIWKLLL
jgi:hypothetical protein